MDKVTTTDFLSIAFQASLGTEAILFGVFGVLYSVFGTHISLITPVNRLPSPIVHKLRQVCQFIAGLIVVNAIITIDSLLSLNAFGLGVGSIVIAFLFIVTILGIAGFSVVWAFLYMRMK
jgi:hypothetical protein